MRFGGYCSSGCCFILNLQKLKIIDINIILSNRLKRSQEITQLSEFGLGG
jgi:hypothetical protein